MALKEERLDGFLDALTRLTREGGEENFVVFEDADSGRFLQFAGRRGLDELLLDVPTGTQELPQGARERLEEMGFEAHRDSWYEVDREALLHADPSVEQAVHEWIVEGRDPSDDRVEELVARGVLREHGGPERESYQLVVPPQRGALLAERIFREVLGAGAEYEVERELHLEGEDERERWSIE